MSTFNTLVCNDQLLLRQCTPLLQINISGSYLRVSSYTVVVTLSDNLAWQQRNGAKLIFISKVQSPSPLVFWRLYDAYIDMIQFFEYLFK